MGRSLYYYDETDSTNARIGELAGAGAPDGTLAVADMQTAGRGRRGRGWDSPPGMNIYMSLLLRPDMDPSDAPMITILMALAVCESVTEVTGEENAGDDTPAARIKWPNDIVIRGRKVCGILTEMNMEAGRISGVIVGVGINVNQGERTLFPEEIRDTATSLKLECGHAIDRSILIAMIMERFEDLYGRFTDSGDLAYLTDRYDELLVSRDREVRVLDPQGEYTGISRGIDDRGELLVETPDGEVHRVYAGEVSVRGLYGYV
ncbi:MAG: biotin--[acetyl-CoA-carboxylase] ligase [Lachnospiraceae bacterium]|nr:biotin--[acetyl-CoA-carboxylase] ligase [Lachnospiraceae bacterium]